MIEVIGVDVGNGLTKTVTTEFVSSVKEFGETKPSLVDKLVKYDNKYYVVGGDRTKTKTDNKTDNTELILALAGIGEELKNRKIKDTEIILSEGLPLERCIAENKKFDEDYYLKGKQIYFEYEDEPHNILIKDVLVNPQCCSAIIDLLSSGTLPDPCIVVDIGSWTVDILPIEGNKPQGAKTKSLLDGVINCMNNCNEEIRRRTGNEVMESQIQQIMRGNPDALPPKYSNIVIGAIQKYVKTLAATLIENKYNIETLTCVFMGGGATVVKNYGKDLFPMAKYITDIRANAIGYEQIGRMKLKKMMAENK